MKIDYFETTDKYTDSKNTCEYIILHHTWWSLVFKDQLKYLSKHTNKVSAHFIIGQEWEIWQIWYYNQTMWHCWTSSWEWKTNLNKYSIWIELVWPWFTSKQKERLKELLLYLTEKLNIPKENIIRHKDIAPWRKVDVDDSLWNKEFNTFRDYIDSLFINNNIMWEYETLFTNNYGKWVVFNDLDWALKKCINEDWTLNTKEFFFLTMVWLERINKKTTNNILT